MTSSTATVAAAISSLLVLTSAQALAQDDVTVPEPPTPESHQIAAPARDASPAATEDAPPEAPTAGSSTTRADESVRVDVVHYGGGPFRVHALEQDARGGPAEAPSCRTPCALQLSPGYFDFEVGHGRGGWRRHAAGNPIRIAPGRRLVLSVHHDHRAGHRIAGWVVFTAAVHALAASFLPLAISGDGGFNPIAPLVIGLPIAVPLFVVALPLMFLDDAAHVELFRPSLADR